MALLFMDGFDHYATADIAKKGWTISNAPTIGAAIGRRGGGGLSLATTGTITKTLPSTYTTLIVGTAYANNGNGADRPIISLMDTATTHIAVQRNTTTNFLSILRGATVLATGTTAMAFGAFNYIELSATISDTVGAYTLKINGVIELTASGIDTRNGGNASVNGVQLSTTSNTGTNSIYDDFYICDTSGAAPNNDFLGDCRIDTIYPTSDGNYSDYTPSTGTSHFALVDETAPNTTDYNSGGTVGHRDSYGMGDLAALSSQTVYAVQVNAAALKDDAGARSIATMVRSSTTNSDGSGVAISTSQQYVSQIFPLNPNGSVAWTETTVNAMEAGTTVTA